MSSFRYNNARSVYLVNEKKIQFRIETTVDGEFSGLIYATFKNKNQIKSIFGKGSNSVTDCAAATKARNKRSFAISVASSMISTP